MNAVLVVNSGSSSIKCQIIDAETGERIAQGLVERIGERASGRITLSIGGHESERQLDIPDHAAGFAALIEEFRGAGRPIDTLGIVAIGHRVVHGASEFIAPTLIDEHVAERILALSVLAPLHNPGHHAAIVAAREAFPDLPQVAVFDTAFHQTMPPEAYTYAVDRDAAEQYGIRRYGFHGISHQVVSRRAAEYLGRPVESLRQIVLHLGNGASMCAVDRGRSLGTSLGMTPLSGLMMGTRSGDIDPGVLLHLLRQGMTGEEIDELLNKRSGFLGFTGSNDFRDVRVAAANGDEWAQLAIEVYVLRARHYVGAYLAQLGGADAIVFTAGLGENAADLRRRICEGFEWCGIRFDDERNESEDRGARTISAPDSEIAVIVVPTDEEAEIASQSLRLVAQLADAAGEGSAA